MKAAIAIDPWKLDIFQRRLTQAGYTFESYPNGELTILQVTTDNMEALACDGTCCQPVPGTDVPVFGAYTAENDREAYIDINFAAAMYQHDLKDPK